MNNTCKYYKYIKEILREYYEQLHAIKFKNFSGMGNFAERHKISKCIYEEINYLYSLMCRKLNLYLNASHKNKHQTRMTSFCQTLQKEISIIYKLSQKIKNEGILPN